MFQEPNPQAHGFSIRKIDENGTQKWFINNELHRENDLPAIIYSDGTKEWYLNGKFIKS